MMSKTKQLLKNTAIVSIGKISTQLITFFLLPVYTAVLTKEEYGIVDLFNTLISLLLPIVTLQIEQGVFRYLIECRENQKRKGNIISSVSIFIILQTLIYIIVFLIASIFIKNEYKYFLATNLVVSIFSSILLQIARGVGDNKKYAIGSFLVGTITVILNVIFIVVFHLGAYGMLLATLIANIICVIYLFVSEQIYKYIKPKYFEKELLKEIIKFSIPLVPNMVSWWIVDASDRSIISTVLGVAQNGIYSTANKFPNVFTSLYNLFNLTWTESVAINIDSQDRDTYFSKIFDVTIRFFCSLALIIVAYMPFIFNILINEKFFDAYYQIPILMLGSIFGILVSFIGTIYVAKKVTKEIAKTSIFSAIINIGINVLMINSIGLYAASISTVISYFVMFIYRLYDSKKYVNLKINRTIVISMIFLYIAISYTYYTKNVSLCIISSIITTIYAVIINRQSAKFIFENIKNKIIKKG